MSFKTAGDNLRRGDSGSRIKLELENRSGFVFQIVRVRTLALAVSQLVGGPVGHGAGAAYGGRGPGDKGRRYRARSDGCIGRDIPLARHTDRERRREFEV